MTKPVAKEQTYLLEGLDNGVARWLVPIAECKEGDTVLNFYNHTDPDFCQREGVLDDRGEIQLMTFYDAYREFIDTHANPLYACMDEAKKAEFDYSNMPSLIINKDSFDARLAACPAITQPFEQKQTECRQLVDSYNAGN